MAIIKHLAVKNNNYNAALDYMIYQHNEETNKPILDEKGRMILRDEYFIDGINCDPFSFQMNAMRLIRDIISNRLGIV